jgi:hypothetical protein
LPPVSTGGGGQTPRLVTFTTPGTFTYTVPPLVTRILIEAWGGGGNSAAAGATAPTSGGGGGYGVLALAVSPGDVLTIVVGAGGGVTTVTNAAGVVVLTANNGAAGESGGAGGTCVGGDLNITGAPGGSATTVISVLGAPAYGGLAVFNTSANGVQPGGAAVSYNSVARTGGAGLVNIWEPATT